IQPCGPCLVGQALSLPWPDFQSGHPPRTPRIVAPADRHLGYNAAASIQRRRMLMPTPFPGMDPYIEAHGDWIDFHGRFTTYFCDVLNATLPEGYAATIDTRLKLVRADEEVIEGRMRPDLGVHHTTGSPRSGSSGVKPTGGAGTATLEPQTLTLPVEFDEIRESAVQIVRFPE